MDILVGADTFEILCCTKESCNTSRGVFLEKTARTVLGSHVASRCIRGLYSAPSSCRTSADVG